MKYTRALCLCVVAIFLELQPAACQNSGVNPPSDAQNKGFTSYVQFQGSSNSLGQIMDLDTRVGYNFSQHFGVDGGVPIYFVRGTTSTGDYSNNGLGNLYGDLRVTYKNPIVNYSTVLTGYAPTADTKHGLSTGRATFDWNNRFDRPFGRLTPFLEAGLGNSIQNSPLFNRPFTTLGFNSHFEGGTEYSLMRVLGVGLSAYAIVPSGQQKIYSKVLAAGSAGQASSHNRFFTTSPQVTGDADLTKDHGFSGWVDAHPTPFTDLLLGYTHSVGYDLNTVSFGLGVNVGYLVHQHNGTR